MNVEDHDDHVRRWSRRLLLRSCDDYLHAYRDAQAHIKSVPTSRLRRLIDAGVFQGAAAMAAIAELCQRQDFIDWLM